MTLFSNDDAPITEFSGDYRWLSNFWPAPVKMDGVCYPGVENAYQAAKTKGNREAFVTCTAWKAKRMGQSIVLGPRWEDLKLTIMEELLRQKFARGSDLAQQLIETGERMIIEGNTWGDTFWGVCQGVGENQLGRLHMTIRNDLAKQKS